MYVVLVSIYIQWPPQHQRDVPSAAAPTPALVLHLGRRVVVVVVVGLSPGLVGRVPSGLPHSLGPRHLPQAVSGVEAARAVVQACG